MPRAVDPRRAKLHHSYTVEEAAEVLGVHPNTVRAWTTVGLPVLDDRRPLLIRGADLRQFLTRRRRDRKRPTGPGRLYCLPCRAAKVPAGGMVDFQPMANGGGNLVGLCPDCERPIYRRVSERSLETVCTGLDVHRLPPAADRGAKLRTPPAAPNAPSLHAAPSAHSRLPMTLREP